MFDQLIEDHAPQTVAAARPVRSNMEPAVTSLEQVGTLLEARMIVGG